MTRVHAPEPAPLRFTLDVELREDLHTGTGTGQGSIVDAIIATDRHGLPVIRATHLKGVLRSNAMERARVIDGVASGPGAREVERLLGRRNDRQDAAKLVIGSLRSKSTQTRVVWASSAREIGSRVPLDESLRSIEHLGAGSKLSAQVELRDLALKNVLDRVIQRTDALGSRRRRGFGLIHVDLNPQPTAIQEVSPPDDQRCVLRFLLRNIEPLCLPETGSPTNLVPTQSYIRAQTLRGALASWLLRRCGREAMNLLLGPGVTVRDAWPLPAAAGFDTSDLSKMDVIPAPLHLGRQKAAASSASARAANDPPWWAASTKDATVKDRFRSKQGTKFERLPDRSFLYRDEPKKEWTLFAPTVHVHLRNGVADESGERYGGDDQKLFSEWELAEDTRFLATLEVDASIANTLHAHLKPVIGGGEWLQIGRGGRPAEVERAEWVDPPCSASNSDHAEAMNHPLVLTLESDLIARSDTLAFYDSLDPWMIAALCGATLPTEVRFRSFSDTVEVRGFNAVSGLPRPPVVAIRRGSSLRVEAGKNTAHALRTALSGRDQFGERTADGFGRFRIDVDVSDLNVQEETSHLAPSPKENVAEAMIASADKQTRNANDEWPSRSQWKALITKVAAAQREPELRGDTKELVRQRTHLIDEIEDASKKLSGEAWRFALVPIRAKAGDEQVDAKAFTVFLDAMAGFALAKRRDGRR